jgi:transposase
MDLLALIPAPVRLLADRAYDTNALRSWLAERGAEAVIPSTRKRKVMIKHDKVAYRERNRIERMFCRLKDFRRIATRYDKRADIFLSAVCLAATVMWWT